MVHFECVSKNYGGHTVLKNISLSLQGHQTHVLLGQSGSGKSTLIRIAAGLLQPSSGHVTLDGQDVGSFSPSERAKIYGFMVQEGGLFPHLTLEDNVLLPAKVHKIDPVASRKRMEDLADLVGLTDRFWSRYPHQLSGGQRQRVALMRALILDPPILFFDEPLGALDPIVRSDLQKELKRIFQVLNKTVVIVTHDLAEAGFFADTLTLLRDGHVEQHGTLSEFLTCPKSDFVKDYFRAQKPPPALKALAQQEDDA
jgi:osmoprotectant transport system ATP-binding protein